jgi:prepilin-type processing-associated H-X9-DG protein
MNNVRQLTLAVILHASANSNACPPAATWSDAVESSVGSASTFQCVAGDKEQRCHYAYNAKLDGLELDKVKNPSTTVMIFETGGGWNVSGGSELLPRQSRHAGAVTVGFVDGHVEMVKESRLSQLQWEP